MSLDLHPEDLLDKWSRGSIAPDEKSRLDEHLELCNVCRFETRARTDFDTEGDVSQADLDAMVSRALGSLASDKKAAEAAAENPRAHRRVPRTAFLLVAAFALLSVEALAGKWSPFHAASAPAAGPMLVETGATEEAPGAVSAAHAHAKAKMIPAPESDTDDTAVSSVSAVDAPVASVAPVGSPVYTNVSSVTTTPAVTVGSKSIGSVGSAGSGTPALENASMIFARANKERTAGDHAQARAAYATLFRRFPMSPEGMLAHATLGRMLLDDGDPSGALVELDTYLAQGDTALREPVLAARATALGRQGRKSAEVEAWSRLLDEYPSSLYASRAHARIEQSGGT